MLCVAEIDAGADQARAELLFLRGLLVELGAGVEPLSEITSTLGFSDVYCHPALGAGNYIRINKASVGLLECLATLRKRALERVRHGVEVAIGHGYPPVRSVYETASSERASASV